MCSEDAFKPPALPYCFGTKAKHEDAALVQIQEITGLPGGVITSTMVALMLVRQYLQQPATELGEDLTADIVFTLKELDGPASTRIGHASKLAARNAGRRLYQSYGKIRASSLKCSTENIPIARLPVQG